MIDDLIERESGLVISSGADRQLRERIRELEDAAEEPNEWLLLGDLANRTEFSRGFITSITHLARIMYLKNTLIQRGVRVKADYVYGRGCTIQARDPDIDEVVQSFLSDDHNQTEFTAHATRIQREIELQIEGNIFFVLIPHPSTGHVRVRTIPVDEIDDIITNPDDRKESWYYKRKWVQIETNLETGQTTEQTRVAYYRDWRYKPDNDRSAIGSDPVIAGQYIYHVKVGGFSDWKFGISEIYAPLDWAKAYKKFLENWSTIVAAYARFAFRITTTGGKQGVAAAKAKLASTITTTSGERNPAPTTGSSIIMQEGSNIDPIKTAGATTKAEDGRRLLLMVAAGFGIPETFFGDVSVGTLATAKSLDRPTELMLSNRQQLWADIYHDILDFVLRQAVIAPNGLLRARGDTAINEYGEEIINFDDGVDTHIDVDFPSIVLHDTRELIGSIVSAATFDGKTPTILNDAKLLARMVLVALGENDIDQLLNTMYPEGTDTQIAPPQQQTQDTIEQAADGLRNAIEALRETITKPSRYNGSVFLDQ